MATPTCPKCNRVIPSDDLNVATDIALCRACNATYSLAELMQNSVLDAAADLDKAPRGVWRSSNGTVTVIGATHRSLWTALGTLAISLFWNGIVSVFVAIAIAGTLQNMDLPLPHWFPAPNMNEQPMSVGMTIFLWIFLTPFIVIGAGMLFTCLSALAGRTEVRINNTDGIVFTGIGPFGFRKRFNPTNIKRVRIDGGQWVNSNGTSRNRSVIVMDPSEGKPIKFGALLSEERRNFVAASLRKQLL